MSLWLGDGPPEGSGERSAASAAAMDGEAPTPETFFTGDLTGGRRPRRGRWLDVAALAMAALLASAVTWFVVSGPSAATSSTATSTTTSTTTSTAAHTAAGMTGEAYWQSVQGAYHPTGVVRTYYVGADEVLWDYAPSGKNLITGKPFEEAAQVFMKEGPDRVGSSYLKCIYRQYTDSTFSTPKPVPADQTYLGFMGPILRGEVGDTIKVVFRNDTCRIPVSMHPHGVFYLKASEGAPYADNTSGQDRLDDAVAKGRTHTYTWLIPDRAGPGPHDGSSVMWMYHSHTDEVADTYAGLTGFMEVTAKGMARADGSPKDVDREIFELYAVLDENQSAYAASNIARLADHAKIDPDDEEFVESNLMHSINGYMYGNQPMVTLKKGQRVRWYLMSMGTEVDLHTPHWHGNDVLVNGMRMDVVNLLPATMVTADMVPDNPGIWLQHCHVNDHLTAGMIIRYQVTA